MDAKYFKFSVAEPEPVNLINNGTFDSDTLWYYSMAPGWVIADGVATYDDVDSWKHLSQAQVDMNSPGVEADASYTLTFDMTSVGDANVGLMIYSYTGSEVIYVEYANYSVGEVVINFTAPAAIQNGGLKFLIYKGGGARPVTLDNISLIKTS